MKTSRIVTFVFIGLLLTAGLPPAQATDGLRQAAAGEEVLLTSGVDDPLVVSVSEARYALGWADVDPRTAVIGDEKLVVVSLTLRNDGDSAYALSAKNLEVQLIDSVGRGHDTIAGIRIRGSTESAESNLLPGVAMNLDVGLLVPGSAQIEAVALRDTRSRRGPGVRIDVSLPASLPREHAADGITVAATVNARTGTWYSLGTTDVRVDGVSRSPEPLLRVRPDEDQEVASLALTVRNRSARELRLHAGLFGDSALGITDGERKPLLLLLETRDQVADFALLPGDEVAVRMIFEVPADADAQRLDLVETVGARGGVLSRRYRVALGAPQGSGPIGVTIDRTRIPTAASTVPAATVEDAIRTGQVSRAAPNPAELPGAVTGRTLTGTEQTLQTAPLETLALETVDIPEVMYVVRLDTFRVEDAQESSGDEPWLITMTVRGRIGDTNPNTLVLRNFLGPVDWGESGEQRSLRSNSLHRAEFTRVRPYDVSGLILFALEGDDSSDAERQRLMSFLSGRARQVLKSEFSRQTDLDYDDFRPVNRDRIVAEFELMAERLESQLREIVSSARSDFSWSSGDTDEIMDLSVLFWINVDDAGNPGVRPAEPGGGFLSRGRDPVGFPTTQQFYRRFYGVPGHYVGGIPPAPGGIRWLLSFEISKESLYNP